MLNTQPNLITQLQRCAGLQKTAKRKRKGGDWLDKVREVKPPKGMDPKLYAALMGFPIPAPTKVIIREKPVSTPIEQPKQPAAYLQSPERTLQDVLLEWLRSGGPLTTGSARSGGLSLEGV